MKVICIIPARLESTRMPRKLLRSETGQPVIAHTVEAVDRAYPFQELWVATDSKEISTAVEDQGISGVIYTGECSSGTDRIAEAMKLISDCDLVVNVQADEPEIQQEHIEALISMKLAVPGCDMATLAARSSKVLDRPNVVKVKFDGKNYATQFSRKWMPVSHHHLGVYAYTPQFLKRFTSLPQSEGEQRERLEQLRALDNGARIRVALVDEAWPGIDTEEEYQAFVKRWKERQCPTTQSASA